MTPRKYDAKYYFGPIETADQAVHITVDCGKMFLFLAVLQGALGFFISGRSALLDALAYAILGVLLWRFHSRVAAVALLVLSGAAIYTTWMNVIGKGSGGRNIVLSVLVFWFSIRAVQATFRLSTLRKSQRSQAAETP